MNDSFRFLKDSTSLNIALEFPAKLVWTGTRDIMFCTSVRCKNDVRTSNVKIRRLYGLVHAIKFKMAYG